MTKSKGTPRTARLKGDLDDEFEDYRTERDMNNSEALRELVRVGLKEVRADPLDSRPESFLVGQLWQARQDIHTFVLVAVVSLLVSTLTGSPVISLAAQLLALGYSLVVLLVAVDTVLLRDRITLRLMDISDRVTVEVET